LPFTDEEKTRLRRLVGDVRALWEAAETAIEDRKRLLRCLIREVVLLRDARRRATGGVTTIRIGWCSGAWSELHVHRPSSTEFTGTPEPVLERIRVLAQQHPDDQVATILNAEGLHTRKGLAWTYLRVGDVRLRHGIPTACPIMPKGSEPRGDGLVSVGRVATQFGVARSVVGSWCRCGFLHAVQVSVLGPRWIRLTEEDLARVDGTLAAQGFGRWRLREAQQMLGLSEEELYQEVREKRLLAYRARIRDHWEWRVSPAAWSKAVTPLQPVGIQTLTEEV
jgi:hypothetical protein